MGFLIILSIFPISTLIFMLCFHFFEKYLDEDHTVMLWWRKHIVGRQDDIPK
jgi:hypothetical protein